MKGRNIVVLGSATVILIAGLLLFRSSAPELATMDELTELPHPNSSSFTFEQAEARKGEIYQMKTTGRLIDWEPPEFGTGFCVHIAKNDTIFVEHLLIPFTESEMERRVRDGIEGLTGNRDLDNPTHAYQDVCLDTVDVLAWLATRFNEPAFVVLTSERDPADSTVFPQVLDRLFKPSIKLHYVPRNDQSNWVGGRF